MKSMNDLMLHFLQDILDAEKRGLRGMQKMARAAEDEELKGAILQHREQSQEQIARLERVFEMLGKRARGKACAAMEGLSDEVDEAIEDGEKGPVLDAALIASAQAVEHYEIARYGAMVAWARQLGMEEAAELLQQTLDEEKQSDERLNEIAEGSMNRQAAESGAEDEEAGEEERKPARGRRASTTRGRAQASAESGAGRTEGEQGEGEQAPARGRRAPATRRRAQASADTGAEQVQSEPTEEEQKPAPRRRAGASRSKAAEAAPSGRSTGGAAKKPSTRRSSRK